METKFQRVKDELEIKKRKSLAAIEVSIHNQYTEVMSRASHSITHGFSIFGNRLLGEGSNYISKLWLCIKASILYLFSLKKCHPLLMPLVKVH